jgi:hypothetical protein
MVFKVPRGPVTGCHVASYYWLLVWLYKIGYGSVGGRTRDVPGANELANWANHVPGGCYLLNIWREMFLSFLKSLLGKKKGSGLAPALRANT